MSAATLEYDAFPLGVFIDDIGASADRRLEEIAFEGAMVHDLSRIVVEVFGHGDLRLVEVADAPCSRLPSRCHSAVHVGQEPQHGRAYFLVEPLFHRED